MTEQEIRDLMRKRLLAGVPEPVKCRVLTSIADLAKSEWSPKFIKFMNNRMIMGTFRYGKLTTQRLINYDRIASLRKRLELYEQTGNTEHLVDCSNICMIEFMIGKHPNKHFSAIDDGTHATIKK